MCLLYICAGHSSNLIDHVSFHLHRFIVFTPDWLKPATLNGLTTTSVYAVICDLMSSDMRAHS